MNLKIGDSGMGVKRIQLLLNSDLKPSPNLRPDGHFGARTHCAVVQFQKLKGLTADGIVGPKTLAALGQKSTPVQQVAAPMGGPPWIEIAQAELGVHENSLPGQQNKRIIEYHSTTTLKATEDEVPWCSSFVNWVMKQAHYTGTGSAAAKSWLDWGASLQGTPRLGAITVIKRKGANQDAATGSSTGFHVAFYVSSTPTHIRLLGGNQSDSVKYSNFPLASYDVKTYRWP
jgi:uncharacterized protein (TIGR02594 family)